MRLVDAERFLGELLVVIIPAGIGGVAYMGLVFLLRIEEVDLLRTLLRKRLQRSSLD
jgi:hypothetical protein